ncbi:MAG: DNA-binding response regulator [Burkholderiales bacterium PBB4]|nr:MAG: DNA-binding response regulator [Burkholderiales bacterium PBB4]
MSPLTVYIVDDEEAVRRQIADEVHLHLPGCAVRTFSSGEAFLDGANLQAHGVLVLDQKMTPGMSGSEVFDRLQKVQSPLCVVFLSANGTIPLVVEKMQMGAVSWLDKWGTVQERVDTLTKAQSLAREKLVRWSDLQSGRLRWERLTLREKQVLAQAAVGKSSKEIAAHLSQRHFAFPIGYRVVENHRARAFAKLDVTSAPEALLFLNDHDLLSLAQDSLNQSPGLAKDE